MKRVQIYSSEMNLGDVIISRGPNIILLMNYNELHIYHINIDILP